MNVNIYKVCLLLNTLFVLKLCEIRVYGFVNDVGAKRMFRCTKMMFRCSLAFMEFFLLQYYYQTSVSATSCCTIHNPSYCPASFRRKRSYENHGNQRYGKEFGRLEANSCNL